MATLEITDFGSFDGDVFDSFDAAFGFTWKPAVDEPLAAASSRTNLSAALEACRATVPRQYAREAALIQELHALRERIVDYLVPGGLELTRRVHRLLPVAARIGRALGGVRRGFERSPNCDQRTRRVFVEAASSWADAERVLDGVRSAAYSGSLEYLNEQVAELSSAITKARRCFVVGAAALAAVRGVPAAERSAALEQIVRDADALWVKIVEIVDSAQTASPPSDEFARYFQRVADAMAPIAWRVHDRSDATANNHLGTKYEVPRDALRIERTEAEQRDAAVGLLATASRDFWPSLPSAVRRDHAAPALRGGKGQRNRVLHGIAAAMILGGFVQREAGDDALAGRDLFRRVVKRITTRLTTMGEEGRLAVDGTNSKLTETGSGYPRWWDAFRVMRDGPLERPAVRAEYPVNDAWLDVSETEVRDTAIEEHRSALEKSRAAAVGTLANLQPARRLAV